MATQNPYSDSLLMDAFRGSLSNAESLGRGFAVAPVGLFGDVNALARQYITPRLPSRVQGLLQAAPAAPTTEQILSNIPRASAPRMETAGMEQLGAAMNPRGPVELAKAVKNMPVGMSIKPVDDVVGLLTPKIDELTGLPLNADGTVTLFHHTNKSAAEQIAKTGRLKSAGEPSVYLTTQKATDTGYGDVAVPVRVKPSLLNLDDEFPSGRMDFRIDTGKPKGSIPVTVEKPSFTYPQEEAMRLAQQRAALPKEQGGLGLLANNTADERAAAMGFDTPAYHATETDFASIRPSATGKMGKGVYTSFDPTYAERYAGGDAARTMPLVTRGEMATPELKSDVSEVVRQQMIKDNPDFNMREWKARSNQALADQGYSGLDVDKERLMFSPEDLRSRFAAFDPFRRTAATAAAMGVAAPDLLAQEQPVITQQQIDDELANYGLLGR